MSYFTLTGALGLVGFIPEVPTEDNMQEVLAALSTCPECHGYTMRGIKWVGGCQTCHDLTRLFWIDGEDFYQQNGHLANDAYLGYKYAVAMDRLRQGAPLAEAHALGPNNYGFHRWRRLHQYD